MRILEGRKVPEVLIQHITSKTCHRKKGEALHTFSASYATQNSRSKSAKIYKLVMFTKTWLEPLEVDSLK